MAKALPPGYLFQQISQKNKKVPIVEDSPMGVTTGINGSVAGSLKGVATIPVRPEDDYIKVLAKRVR